MSYPFAEEPGTVRKSGALMFAAIAAVASSLSGVIWAIILLAEGENLVKPIFWAYIEHASDSEMDGWGQEDPVDAIYSVFTTRADFWVALGVLTIGVASMVPSAKNWARILLTVLAIGNIGFAARDLLGADPGLLTALDAVILIGMVIAVVCLWLPGSNKAVRERAAAR